MKFLYQYRTPDNKPHRGVICAPTKEAAYAAIKAQGIKPGRVEEAPGFFNKLFGKGKRWIAIGVLCTLCLVLCAVVYTQGARHEAQSTNHTPPDILDRAQLYGDPVVIAECEAAGWTNVFAAALDRYLVHYAIPGRAVPPPADVPQSPFDLSPVAVSDGDLAEVAQMKRMVNGMKRELAEYLSDGGSFDGYRKRLDIRQRAERNFYEICRARILSTKSHEEWKVRNAQLRAKGLPMVEPPDPVP